MESLSRASKENIDLVSESILLYTFSRLNYEHEKYDSCVNKIIEITEEDFSNPQLSISSIVEELGYNSKYLSHIFKKKAVLDILNTCRISELNMPFPFLKTVLIP